MLIPVIKDSPLDAPEEGKKVKKLKRRVGLNQTIFINKTKIV